MSNRTIQVIDYGMGNIGSVTNALDYLGGEYFVSSRKEDLRHAGAFILPGVGAFATAIANLQKLDLMDELTNSVIELKKPYLGICLGMQLVVKDSLEQGFTKGLGWIDGHVLPVTPKQGFRVPHVGWNTVVYKNPVPLFQRIDAKEAHFYFDHSFHVRCGKSVISATFEYGEIYVAAMQKENIFATQFHPEKSQRNGLKLLRNFLNFVKRC